MNIFVLSESPKESALMMIDKHVIKMPTESMQMVSTNLNYLGIDSPYKPVMLNHPCTIWSRTNRNNAKWLVNHCKYLCQEYTKRYSKIHRIEELLEEYSEQIQMMFNTLPDEELTPFAQAMPDKYRNGDAVKAYRQYYLSDKWNIASWKCEMPSWWPNNHILKKKQERIIKFNKQFNANIPLPTV